MSAGQANVTDPGGLPVPPTMPRSTARLAAVQALYQVSSTDTDYPDVVRDFLSGRLGGTAIDEDPDTEVETSVKLVDFDHALFADLLALAQDRQDDIAGMIEGSLSADWPIERLELIVDAILRIGVAELLSGGEVPARVVISEYVDIAHAFYSGPEPKMVNAVLDKIARALHGDAFAAAKPD